MAKLILSEQEYVLDDILSQKGLYVPNHGGYSFIANIRDEVFYINIDDRRIEKLNINCWIGQTFYRVLNPQKFNIDNHNREIDQCF